MADERLRVLAIGAHPDDVEFGCGGVLLVEAARGSEIAVCVCSRGEAASNGSPAEREAEARRAAEMLDARLEFVDLGGDCHIEADSRNAIAIAGVIRRVRPHVVLAPVASGEQHPDHTAVGVLCRNAARLARYGGVGELRESGAWAVQQLSGYAVTPGAEPRGGVRLRVDISAQFERWVQLMECHQSQLRTRRYIELQTARARALGIEAGVEYAQALFPGDDFLVDNLAALPRSVRLF